jgi:hypothetical protein
MKLTDEQITGNWQKLLDIVESNFTGERKQAILAMYDFFQDRMLIAPASGLKHYHNCFEGGYIDHVIRVVECAQKLDSAWNSMGAQEEAYTQEELVFSALHHDLGKIGDREYPYYVPNPSEWHRKNQGKIYDFCSELQHMSVPDRALFLLQEFGVKYSANEAIAIRCSDGLYDVASEAYFKTYNPQKELRNHLPILLHHADHMASRIEHDMAKASMPSVKPSISSNHKKTVSKANEKATDLFKDLFGE